MVLTKNNIRDIYKSKRCDVETMELKGYELVDNLFVDSSGFGQYNEPALTVGAFEKRVTELLNDHGSLYSFITDMGQFQVYVGLFKKTGKKKSKVVANNTLKIETDTGYIIRLYATNIFELSGNKITLNSGGYQTKTTKERLNTCLHEFGYYVKQKNYQWHVMNRYSDTKLCDFRDGLEFAKGTI